MPPRAIWRDRSGGRGGGGQRTTIDSAGRNIAATASPGTSTPGKFLMRFYTRPEENDLRGPEDHSRA